MDSDQQKTGPFKNYSLMSQSAPKILFFFFFSEIKELSKIKSLNISMTIHGREALCGAKSK